jgi:hypothetical protein
MTSQQTRYPSQGTKKNETISFVSVIASWTRFISWCEFSKLATKHQQPEVEVSKPFQKTEESHHLIPKEGFGRQPAVHHLTLM